jgi:TPR repeat protein
MNDQHPSIHPSIHPSVRPGYTAFMFHHGQGDVVPQRHSKAVTWWHRAALQGHSEAQYTLGVMFETGKGVKKNMKLAAEVGL